MIPIGSVKAVAMKMASKNAHQAEAKVSIAYVKFLGREGDIFEARALGFEDR